MTRWLDKLNLRPQERKLVIFVAVVVFAAFNWFFVKPYFGELGRTQQHMKEADEKIKKFNDEIAKKAIYDKQLADLSKQGAQIALEEIGTVLTREVDDKANAAGVNVQSSVPAPHTRDGRTNAFFEEQGVNLTFNNTGEAELVNFLYNLASQKSLIRVKSMNLHPDPGDIKLGGTLTLVESFQKKQPVRTAAASAAATPKPAPVINPVKASNSTPKTVTAPKTPPAPGKTNDLKRVLPPASNLKKT